MAIPRTKSIIREDIPGAPDWIEALLTLLNRGFGDVTQVLDRGLTASENMLAEVKTIKVKMPDVFPTWHVVGAAGEPAFENAWANHAATDFGPTTFRMSHDGYVEIQGLVTKSPAPLFSIIFTLPVGFRPSINHIFAQACDDGTPGKHAEVRVLKDGKVQVQFVQPTYSGNMAFLSLHGIRFQTAAVAAKADLFPKPFPIQVATSGRFPIKDVQAMQWRDVTDKARGVLGPGQVVWESDGTGLRITAIWGLQPGRTYEIDLLLTAG